MNGKEYAQTVSGFAGAIRALNGVAAPPHEGCQAHAIAIQISEIHAQKMEADAAFYGNGFITEIVNRMKQELTSSGLGAAKPEKVFNLAGFMVSTTTLFRIVLATMMAIVMLHQWIGSKKIDPKQVQELERVLTGEMTPKAATK